MRKILFSPALPRDNAHPASTNTLSSVIKFASQIGFQVRAPRGSRRSFGLFDYYAQLLTSYVRSDIFLTSYPYVYGSIFSDNPLRRVDQYVIKLLGELGGR